MTFGDAFAASVDRGVTERPYVFGWSYQAFCVHPPLPGPVVLAVAHREGELLVLDLVCDGLTVRECSAIADRYRITAVVGQVEDGAGDNLVHAAAGAMHLAGRS